MIWESSYWKDGLLKLARDLKRRTMHQKCWPEASLAHLEQSLMVGFYSIRKLMEARKLSESTTSRRFVVKAYRCKGKPVTFLNWHHLDALYDLENPENRDLDLKALCNQFIHSYVFSPVFSDDNRLQSILVTSDHQRSRVLYEVSIEQLISLFELAGADYPNHISWHYDPIKRDYIVHASTEQGLDE